MTKHRNAIRVTWLVWGETFKEKVFPNTGIFLKGENSPLSNFFHHKIFYDQNTFCCLEELHAWKMTMAMKEKKRLRRYCSITYRIHTVDIGRIERPCIEQTGSDLSDGQYRQSKMELHQ